MGLLIAETPRPFSGKLHIFIQLLSQIYPPSAHTMKTLVERVSPVKLEFGEAVGDRSEIPTVKLKSLGDHCGARTHRLACGPP